MANVPLGEDFLQFESKVDQIMRLLEEMNNMGKSEDAKPDIKPLKTLEPGEEFIISIKNDRTAINKSSSSLEQKDSASGPDINELNKFTFMRQLEEDAEQRFNARKEQERIAHNFRKMGNDAFRRKQFEKAINLYSKAIDHVKDSPILYNNRSLCYYRLKNYKRALIDSDLILNKLDEKNMRAWLYRAAAYKRLGDDRSYEDSIRFARKNNSKNNAYIDQFIERLKTDF